MATANVDTGRTQPVTFTTNQHAEKLVQPVSTIESKIRVEYRVKWNETFHSITKHKNFLNALKKATNNQLTIIPNDNSQSYTSINNIPPMQPEFEKQFEVFTKDRPKSVVICHTIRTNTTLADLKKAKP